MPAVVLDDKHPDNEHRGNESKRKSHKHVARETHTSVDRQVHEVVHAGKKGEIQQKLTPRLEVVGPLVGPEKTSPVFHLGFLVLHHCPTLSCGFSRSINVPLTWYLRIIVKQKTIKI